MTEIDYYWFPLSPYCYLAGLGLEAAAARRGAAVRYRPFALLEVFAQTGTLPPGQRHPSRQAYRLKDLERVAHMNGLPINLRPRHWPTNPVPAAAALAAAEAAGGGDVGALAHAIGRACWAEERDVAEDGVVKDLLAAHGFDPALADRGLAAGVAAYERNTQAALDAGVFGAPSYVVAGELFWGQDRLPHLEAFLAARAG